jgi:hypothetical protein
MPAGATIIGRVAIKVVPDTSDFRALTKRELDKIESRMGRLKVKVDLDTKGLNEKVRGAVAEAERNVRDITLRVNVDNQDSLRRSADRIRTEFDKLGEIELDVDLNERDLRAALDLLNDELNDTYRKVRQEINQTLSGIKVRPELDDSDVRRATRDIEVSIERIADLRAKITPELDDRSRREVERQIEALEDKIRNIRSTIELKTRVDTDGLRRMLRGLANIGASAVKFAALGTAIGGIAALSLSAASNLAALAVSLATLAPAAVVLPGLLVGLGLGLAATVLALKDFNTVLPDVKGKLSDLQDQMSEKFWAQAKAPIRDFIDTLLPQFGAGMTNISTNLGRLFGDLATSLKSSLDGLITPMFDKLGQSIEIARGATDGFAGIIAKLGQVGADYLPRLSQWMVDLTNRFDAFLTGAAADGRLTGWIDTALQGFRDLGSVIGGIGGILYGVGTAAVAAGGSVLGTFGAALQRVSDVVNSPAFLAGLTAVFASAHEALDRIATASGPGVTAFFSSLATLLPTLLPIIGDALGTALGAVATALSSVAVQTAVVTLFEAFRTAVELLAPVLTGLTDFLSEHTTVAKVLALVLGTIVVAAYTALAISSAVTTTKVVAANLSIAGSAVVTAAKTVASWASMTAAFVAGTASLVHSVAIIAATYVKLAAQALVAAAKTVASWVAMAAGAVASALVHTAQVAVMVAKWVFLGAQLMALAESPQGCSSKFPTLGGGEVSG